MRWILAEAIGPFLGRKWEGEKTEHAIAHALRWQLMLARVEGVDVEVSDAGGMPAERRALGVSPNRIDVVATSDPKLVLCSLRYVGGGAFQFGIGGV